MQNRSKLLLHFAHATGSAGCANVSCGVLFPPDNDRRHFLAICCPRCCSVLYCSIACMARHSNFHTAACHLFNGYGVAPGLERRKRQRLEPPTDPRIGSHQVEDLTGQPAVLPHATALQAVAAPAAITVVAPVAPIPAAPPAIVSTPPVPNPVITQVPVDFPTETGIFIQVVGDMEPTPF
jgi:hypothetical protein